MDNCLLWFWGGTLAATALWWAVMLVRVAVIGPFELLRMFRQLNRPDEGETSPESNRSA